MKWISLFAARESSSSSNKTPKKIVTHGLTPHNRAEDEAIRILNFWP